VKSVLVADDKPEIRRRVADAMLRYRHRSCAETGSFKTTLSQNPLTEVQTVKSVLVADDKPEIRRRVADAMLHYGFNEILEAENGQQAVDMAITHKPLLIVMDYGMPGLNGIEAAEIISTKCPTPIVLLTTRADTETIEKARKAGIGNYVVEPFREDQLFPAVDLAIHHFIEVSSLRQEVAKLKDTLEARKVIEKAKGALMRQGLSEAEAYRKIQKTAMNKRRTLKEVAEAVLLALD
jgi:response regulator NasT